MNNIITYYQWDRKRLLEQANKYYENNEWKDYKNKHKINKNNFLKKQRYKKRVWNTKI